MVKGVLLSVALPRVSNKPTIGASSNEGISNRGRFAGGSGTVSGGTYFKMVSRRVKYSSFVRPLSSSGGPVIVARRKARCEVLPNGPIREPEVGPAVEHVQRDGVVCPKHVVQVRHDCAICPGRPIVVL